MERAAMYELALCVKRILTPQVAERERAQAARMERRRAAAEERRKKAAAGPPSW
jgi:hypothetical protein